MLASTVLLHQGPVATTWRPLTNFRGGAHGVGDSRRGVAPNYSPGDLAVLDGHVAMVVGNGMMAVAESGTASRRPSAMTKTTEDLAI